MKPLETLYAHEAYTFNGHNAHAVLLAELPKDRAEKIYTTPCGQWIKGDHVYRTPFDDRNSSVPRCNSCVRAIARKRVTGATRILKPTR